MSMQKVKFRGQRSRSQRSLSRFRTVTQVWIHIRRWYDARSLMLLRRGALLFFYVVRQFWRSHGQKILDFDPNWGFPNCNTSLNLPIAMKWCTQLEVAKDGYPVDFQGHPSNFKVTRDKKLPILTRIERLWTVTPVLNSHMALKWCTLSGLNVVLRCPIVFQGQTFKVARDKKNHQFYPNWAFPDYYSSLNSLVDLKWCTQLNVM